MLLLGATMFVLGMLMGPMSNVKAQKTLLLCFMDGKISILQELMGKNDTAKPEEF